MKKILIVDDEPAQVSHLRDKIETDPKHPDYLKTVRGFGYQMEAPHE